MEIGFVPKSVKAPGCLNKRSRKNSFSHVFSSVVSANLEVDGSDLFFDEHAERDKENISNKIKNDDSLNF